MRSSIAPAIDISCEPRHVATWVTHRCVREPFSEWAAGDFDESKDPGNWPWQVYRTFSNTIQPALSDTCRKNWQKYIRRTISKRLIKILARFLNFDRFHVTHTWLTQETLCKNMPLPLDFFPSWDRFTIITGSATYPGSPLDAIYTRAINRKPTYGSPWLGFALAHFTPRISCPIMSTALILFLFRFFFRLNE